MNLWLILTLVALTECGRQHQDVPSCPDLCFCSFPPTGAEVMCNQSSLAHFPVDALPLNTTQLSIQSTNLTTVTSAHLSLVPLLTKLKLSHNNLTSLPPGLLDGLPHLHKLDLTGSGLMRLPTSIFSLASLRHVTLMKNLLEEVKADWFPFNSSITLLDLSGNNLTSIPADLFQRLPHLAYLYLSENRLQELQPDILKNLKNLKVLDLTKNQLVSLEPATFRHNLELTHLFLHGNRLQDLPVTLFQGQKNLSLLLLGENQLRSLPTGLLDDINPSLLVTLDRNPWQCNEEIKYLWKFLTSNPKTALFRERVACDGPETLKNKRLIFLKESQLRSVN